MHGVDFEDCFLSLDLSTTSTGWAALRGPSCMSGTVKFRRNNQGQFLTLFSKWLRDMVTSHQPAIIAVEAPFIGHASAAAPLHEMHGVLKLTLAGYVGAVDFVPNSSWKKTIIGKGSITQKDKKAGVVVNHLKSIGIDVDSIDEADAVCVGLFERHKLTGKLI